MVFFNSNKKVWFAFKINKLLPSLVFHIVLPPFLTPPMFKAKPNGKQVTKNTAIQYLRSPK